MEIPVLSNVHNAIVHSLTPVTMSVKESKKRTCTLLGSFVRSRDNRASWGEHQKPVGLRGTEYEEHVKDLELLILKERKGRGHMDIFKYLEYFYVQKSLMCFSKQCN